MLSITSLTKKRTSFISNVRSAALMSKEAFICGHFFVCFVIVRRGKPFEQCVTCSPKLTFFLHRNICLLPLKKKKKQQKKGNSDEKGRHLLEASGVYRVPELFCINYW